MPKKAIGENDLAAAALEASYQVRQLGDVLAIEFG
jgi:hypothetical protein